MATPALAEMRRRQQPIDEPLVSIGSGIGDKTADLVDRRQKPDEIQPDAANQCSAIGFGGWFESSPFELRQNEPVDFVSNPAAALDCRDLRTRGSLK